MHGEKELISIFPIILRLLERISSGEEGREEGNGTEILGEENEDFKKKL